MALFDGLSFGWRTALLFVMFVQLLVLAIALTRVLQNRVANRTMAAARSDGHRWAGFARPERSFVERIEA